VSEDELIVFPLCTCIFRKPEKSNVEHLYVNKGEREGKCYILLLSVGINYPWSRNKNNQ